MSKATPGEFAKLPYEWTRGRLLLGAGIILAGAVVVTAMFVHHDRTVGRSVEDLHELMAVFEHGVRQRETVDAVSAFNLSNLKVPREAILHGGPAKDGIPALVDPETVAVSEADFLPDETRVIGVTVGGVSRAYPLNVLIWHEAVNDVVGAVPIAVVYCPLCDSASVLDRQLEGRTYTFGVSGLVMNSNVLLYDQTDEGLWSQLGLQAISGPNAGKTLSHLPWELTTFERWRREQPQSTVITLDTGHRRDYDRHGYGDYFETDKLYFPVRIDDRLPIKELVVGVQLEDRQRAYPVAAIRAAPGGRLRDFIGEQPIELMADDAGGVRTTGSSAQAMIVHTYWFAWAAFHPGTSIWRSEEP